MTSHPRSHSLLSISYHPVLHHSFLRTAACLRTTRAADVAAALLRAALTATYAEEHDEEESADDDQQDGQPVVYDEFDFAIRVTRRVAGSVDAAEVHAVIPPHHLSDDQVSLVLNGNFTFSVFCAQHGLINAPLLDHGADRALAVGAVIGGVLAQLQSGLIACGVELQHRVFAERLVPPGDQDILRVR